MEFDLNREFSTEKKTVNAWTTFNKLFSILDIREMQIKTALIYHHTPVRIDGSFVEDVKKGERSSSASGSANLYSHFGNNYGGFSEN